MTLALEVRHSSKPVDNLDSEFLSLTDGKTILVKASVLYDDSAYPLYAIHSWDFDELTIVLFNATGSVGVAMEGDMARVREIATRSSNKDRWLVSATRKLIEGGVMRDVTAQYLNALDPRNKLADFSSATKNHSDPLLVLQNKKFATACVKLLEESHSLEQDIECLVDSDYCKQILKHSFAILKLTTGLSREEIATAARDSHGNRRYYESPFLIRDNTYIVSNDWYGLGVSNRDNRTPFVKWLRSKKLSR